MTEKDEDMDVTYYDDAAPRRPFVAKAQSHRDAGGAISRKAVATACVVGWSAFWVFGFLALSDDFEASSVVAVEVVTAAMGFGVGMWAYLRLCQDAPSAAQSAAPRHPEVDIPD